MISFWISVVPPNIGKMLNILVPPPHHCGQNGRAGQGPAHEFRHHQRLGRDVVGDVGWS